MKLPQLFKEAELPQADYEKYLNPSMPAGMPILDVRRLAIAALSGEERLVIKIPYNGTGTLVIRYNGQNGGLLSVDEKESGEIWDITQVQGAKSRKSYRVSTSLNWHSLLAARTRDYATHPESEVRQITMAPVSCMSNIEYARSECVEKGYGTVRSAFGMRWSEEMKLFIADVRSGLLL